MTLQLLSRPLRAAVLAAALLAVPLASHAADSNANTTKADALFHQGKRAVDQKQYAQALGPLDEAGKLGDVRAMKLLAGLYYEGLGVRANQTEALRWYLRAANRGDADAMTGACRAYADGRGNVARDYAASAMWCRKAADHGNAEAMFLMGLAYTLGLGEGEGGVAKDPTKANRWLQKAARLGEPNAKKMLAQAGKK